MESQADIDSIAAHLHDRGGKTLDYTPVPAAEPSQASEHPNPSVLDNPRLPAFKDPANPAGQERELP